MSRVVWHPTARTKSRKGEKRILEGRAFVEQACRAAQARLTTGAGTIIVCDQSSADT
jgi:hypothetical protein